MLAAFDQNHLERLVAFRLGERLDTIVPVNADFSAVTFDLLLWAKRGGRLRDLLVAALRANPSSPELNSIAMENRISVETPKEFLIGISREFRTVRGWIGKSVFAIPFVNLFANIGPLWPTAISSSFVTLFIFGVVVVIGTVSNPSVRFLRYSAAISGILAIVLLFFYMQLAKEFIHPKENRYGDFVRVTKGDEYTDVGSLVKDRYVNVEALLKDFDSPDQVWTEESIGRAQRKLAKYWFGFWLVAAMFYSSALQFFRLDHSHTETTKDRDE